MTDPSAEPTAWLLSWPDGDVSFYRSKPRQVVPGVMCEPLYRAAPAEVREATIEECAKIADQVAINAERRAAQHVPQSKAQEAAYNKMEGATDVAHAIRSRTSQLSRPTSGGAA